MKPQVDKTKMALASALILVLILAGVFYYGKTSVNKELEKEKIRSEALLSEKLNLDKSVEKFKKDLAALTGKNTKLDKLVAENTVILQQKEKEINKLKAENATIPQLRKKNAELTALSEKLNRDLGEMNLSLARMENENKELNGLLASARKDNESLTAENIILKAMAADNYRVEALRGKNEKLTVNAKRTNKLLVSFDLPADIGNGIYFNLETPDGNEYSSKTDKSATVKISNTENLVASSSARAAGKPGNKRIEMIFKPETKLVKGVYKFNVHDADKYVGSIQIRLK